MSKTNIYNKLFAFIGNPYGVCGLMGNIKSESNFSSTNMQNSYEARIGMNDATYTQAVDNGRYTDFAVDRVGYGLCQWTSSGRKSALLAFAKEKGKSIGDEDMQIDFILHELSISYKKVLEVLKKASSVKEASDYVCTKYERPADQSAAALSKREKNGIAIFNEFVKEEAGKDEGTVKLKVVIDAGHGKNTAGKRCLKSLDANETREWLLNSRIADKLCDLLDAYDCEVLRVDDITGKKDISLNERCKKANDWKADIYISIHHNAGIEGGSGGGTVVFYYSSKAEREAQAQALYNALVNNTGLAGNRAEKVIKKGYTVLSDTNMPAFLIENGFMDSATDIPIILSESHATKTAQGLLDFLIDAFDLAKAQGKTTETPEKAESTTEKTEAASALPFLVKITASALNVRAGAGTSYKINTCVKNGEIFTIIEEKAGWGRLKSGAGWIRLKYAEKC